MQTILARLKFVSLPQMQKPSRRDEKTQRLAEKNPLRFLCVSAALRALFSLLLVYAATAFGQDTVKIHGKVMNADSQTVAFAAVRVPGLDATQTDANGYFAFTLSKQKAESIFFKPGVDVKIIVEKAGMVMLDPPELDPTIRLPQNWTYQKPFEIYLAAKGSPALLRSERMLEQVFQNRLTAAIAAKDKEVARLLELAQDAARLGLPEEELRVAVENYKESLRTSPDLNKQGLALLDNANSAREYKTREQNLEQAETAFREADIKNRRAIAEGRKAEALQPEIDFNLGMTLFEKVRYDSAALYFAKADSADPNNVEKLNMLGRTLHELAQYDQAMQAFQRAFVKDTTTYGWNHPNVARALNNIASALHMDGDYMGALEKYYEALRIDETYSGRNHPDVAIGLSNIGEVLHAQGDYAGALENFNEALNIDESYFRRNHPAVAIDLNNIGEVLRAQDEYAGALEKYTEALKIDESYFGRNHPNVARELNNIALILNTQGDSAGALGRYNEALKILESTLGRVHPKVATVLNNIGRVLKSQGNYVGALEKYTEALKICERTFGRVHPQVATALNNIAGLMQAKGDYAGALEKYNEALKILESRFGRIHPHVATALSNIASVLYAQKKYEDALQLFSEALQILKTRFKDDNLNIGSILWWMAEVLSAKGEHLKAVEHYEQAFCILNSLLGPNHSNTKAVATNLLSLLNRIGVGYIKQAKADSALIYLQQALPLAQQLNEQETLGTLYNNLGSAYKLKQDWPQALQWLEKSVAHNRSVLGDSASVLAYTYFHLAGVAHAQGQSERAREYAQKSLALAARNKLAELQKEAEALLRQVK